MKSMFKFSKVFIVLLFLLSTVAYAGTGEDEMINSMFGLAVAYFILHGCEFNFTRIRKK